MSSTYGKIRSTRVMFGSLEISFERFTRGGNTFARSNLTPPPLAVHGPQATKAVGKDVTGPKEQE